MVKDGRTGSASPSGTASAGRGPKRMRVSRACEQCRSRKAKCDGKTPSCTPCATMPQKCTYGPEPKKRGLQAGSVSSMERTIKMLQRVLGLLFVSIEGSEQATLSLVRRCGRTVFDDGEEGQKLSSAWKDGSVSGALEALRSGGTSTTEEPLSRKDSQDASPAFDLAPEQFQRAIASIVDLEESPRESSGGEGGGAFPNDAEERARGHNATVGMSWAREEHREDSNIDPSLRDDGPSPQVYTPDTSNTFAPDSQIRDDHSQFQQQSLLTELPPNSRLLLDMYFTYTHSWFPILDKYDLIRFYHGVNSSLSSSLENPRRKVPEITNGQKALLYAVLTLAKSQHEGICRPVLDYEGSPPVPSNSSTAPSPISPSASSLYRAAQQWIFTPAEEYSLGHVQALLLLSLVNISMSHLSTAWLMIGHAGRLAIEIGLNSPGRPHIHMRTWLGYLILETFISLRLHREPQVRDNDWEVTTVEEDGWEEWDSWKDLPVAAQRTRHSQPIFATVYEGPAHILSVFNQLVSLSRIARRITVMSQVGSPGMSETASIPNNPDWQQLLRSRSRAIIEQLLTWNDEVLPPTTPGSIYTARDPAAPHMINLQMYYHFILMELTDRCSSLLQMPPAISAASSTITMLDNFRSSRSLAVAPCTAAHFAERASLEIGNANNIQDHYEGVAIQRANLLKAELVNVAEIHGLEHGRGLLRKITPNMPPERSTIYPQDGSSSFPGQIPSTFPMSIFPQQTSTVSTTNKLSSLQIPSTPASAVELRNPPAPGSTQPMLGSQAMVTSSPDGYDEEMEMLDGGLPWSQNGIPEFIENLGYVGGFSPSAFRGEQQQPLSQQAVTSVQHLGGDGSGPSAATAYRPGDGDRDMARHGLNTVLEQWLGDVLGAGDGRGLTDGGDA